MRFLHSQNQFAGMLPALSPSDECLGHFFFPSKAFNAPPTPPFYFLKYILCRRKAALWLLPQKADMNRRALKLQCDWMMKLVFSVLIPRKPKWVIYLVTPHSCAFGRQFFCLCTSCNQQRRSFRFFISSMITSHLVMSLKTLKQSVGFCLYGAKSHPKSSQSALCNQEKTN